MATCLPQVGRFCKEGSLGISPSLRTFLCFQSLLGDGCFCLFEKIVELGRVPGWGDFCIALGFHLLFSHYFECFLTILNVRLFVKDTLQLGIKTVTLEKLEKIIQKKLEERMVKHEASSLKGNVP